MHLLVLSLLPPTFLLAQKPLPHLDTADPLTPTHFVHIVTPRDDEHIVCID
jgi:hypothetical protein